VIRLTNFLKKIDDALLFRRPDLMLFKEKSLTKEYFSMCIHAVLGIKHTDEELNVLFNYFDKDGDGTLVRMFSPIIFTIYSLGFIIEILLTFDTLLFSISSVFG
jgi:hypothetical protein